MHFVGKILVVLQLILSIFFMAFAGVVYKSHMNWREETRKQKDLVTKVTKERDDTLADLTRVKNQMANDVQQAVQKQSVAEAANKNLKDALTRISKEKEDDALARKTASQQAKIAGEEAEARHEES